LQKAIFDIFLLTLSTLTTTKRPSLLYPTVHTYKHELFFAKISTVELIVEELWENSFNFLLYKLRLRCSRASSAL